MKKNLYRYAMYCMLAVAALTVTFGYSFFSRLGVGSANVIQSGTIAERDPKIHQTYVFGMTRTLGSLPLVQPGAKREEVRQSVDAVASFIESRSGFQLSQAAKDELVNREIQFANGGSGVPVSEIAPTLANRFVSRLQTLTDEEMQQGSESMAGIQYSDDSKPVLRIVLIGGQFNTKSTPDQFAKLAKSVRDEPSFQNGVRVGIRQQIDRILDDQIPALEEAFGSSFVYRIEDKKFVSPLRFTLLTYSLASFDYLIYETDFLRRSMESRYRLMRVSFPSYPPPQSFKPFGVNGYIAGSPLNLFLDGTAIPEILASVPGLNKQ